MPRKAELAYLAGILDGEGTITISRQPRMKQLRPYFCPRVTIVNTWEPLLSWILNRFPVGHSGIKRYAPSTGGTKTVYLWSVENRAMRPLLRELLPYLIVKRRQAELVLQWTQPSDTWRGRRPDGRTYNRSQRRNLGITGRVTDEMYATQERLFAEMRVLNGTGGKARWGVNLKYPAR